MTESEEDRLRRRARAMFRACRPDRDWDAAEEAEREHWLAAAHAVEASDSEAGLQPMPLDRPFGGQRSGGRHRGLGAHSPALGAMYDLSAPEADPGRPDEPGATRAPEEPGTAGEESGMPIVVRALLALGAFIAAAGVLLALGYFLAGGSL
jgi:hypothetical protein